MYKSLVFSTAICAALVTSPVLAADKPESRAATPETTGQQYGQNDAGGHASGGTQGADFNELDRDGNGQLDQEELNRYGDTAAGRQQNRDSNSLIDEYDQDDDDTLNKEEFEQSTRAGRDIQGD